MKKSSDDLFQLIKSLSGQEKRYFKIFASRHTIGEKNNYLKLFDAIDKQKKYDETEIKEKLQKEKFIKQLFVVKSYLYEMILKSQDAYYSESSIALQLKQSVHYIEILSNKGLYEQCAKMIDKAERLALKHESFLTLLEIINWKFKLARTSTVNKTFENDLDALHQEKQSIIEKTSNYYQYQWLNTKLYSKAMQKGWFPRSPEEIKLEYDPIISQPIYENESKALSVQAKMLFHNTISAYFHLKGDTEKSYTHSKKSEKILNENASLIDNNQEDYISCLSNLIFTSMFLGKYEETFQCINILKKTKPRSKSLQAAIITSAYLPEIISYNINGYIDAGLKLIPEIENKLQSYENHIHPREILYLKYNFACLYFKANEFKKSAHWLFVILNDSSINFLPDLHTKTKILNLMVQSELDSVDLLPYILRSTYRFLLKQKRLYKFEKKVINFIRNLPNVSSKEITAAYKNLKLDLLELGKDPYEKKAMDFFGFINWLDRKVDLAE